jgi:crotonobetainyl-CoA:carnitine CoA-transferase CaiB-like acyl-CoA transferase
VGAVAARIGERPAAEWLERLTAAGVPAGLVKGVLEALAEEGASALTGVAPSVPGTVRLPPPRLGEHGSELRVKGWDAFREPV